jgi:hypothetical protein
MPLFTRLTNIQRLWGIIGGVIVGGAVMKVSLVLCLQQLPWKSGNGKSD